MKGSKMVRIRSVADPSVLEYRPQPRKPRELSPRARERLAQERKLARGIISKLTDPSRVFEVKLGPDDKPATIRRRLLKVAADAGVEIAVRPFGDRFFVGLMTPERRSRRGRKPGSRRAAAAKG